MWGHDFYLHSDDGQCLLKSRESPRVKSLNLFDKFSQNDWLVDWLIVFNFPSTSSFRDGIPIYCPL